MKRQKSYWIKERHNPQLGVYYVACGQLSKRTAKLKEDALYGDNVMLEFADEASYNAKLIKLREQGESVQ